MDVREIIQNIEDKPTLPDGRGDRFGGYAVIGLPFRSGHVLAMRRFPASSIGAGYTSVWHRSPQGEWTFYSTIAPEQGCSRYFGGEVHRNVVAPIEIVWTGATQFSVIITDALEWEVTLTETSMSRLMNVFAGLIPDSWWQAKMMLKAMGCAARIALGTGKLNLLGTTPNGQQFMANPRQAWLIDSSRAVINGTDAGIVGALSEQARLNDFLIPQRGVFAVARAFLSAPARETWVQNPVARMSERQLY
jgi:hypothetical protein